MCSNSSKQWVTVRFLASQTASAHHTASPIFPVCSYLIKEQKNSPRRLGINLTEPTVQIFFKPACYPLTFSFLNVQGNVNNHRLYNLLDVYLNIITKKYNMSYCTDLQTVQKRKTISSALHTHTCWLLSFFCAQRQRAFHFIIRFNCNRIQSRLSKLLKIKINEDTLRQVNQCVFVWEDIHRINYANNY